MAPNRSHSTVCRKHLRYVFIPIAMFLFPELTMALPVVTDLGIVAGERGVAVTFSADAPFEAVFSGSDKTISAILKGCVYGLPEFSYSNFPVSSPLRSITAAEGRNTSVVITIQMKQPAGVPVKSVRKGNQWIALLSDIPADQFSWSAGTGGIPPSAPAALPNQPEVAVSEKKIPGPARLRNVRMLQRGLVCELAFEFDADVTGNLQRNGNRISVAVDGAVNALGNKNFKLPVPSPFHSVGFRERMHQGTPAGLDVTVLIDTASIESDFNVAFTRGTVISLFVMNRDNQKAMLWTSGHGVSWNYDFYEVPSYKVDLASLNKRAIRDANLVVSRKKTFAVKTPPETESLPAGAAVPSSGSQLPPVVDVPSAVTAVATPEVPASAPVERERMVVVSDNVNLRSLPSKNGKVRAVLSRGATVSVTGKKDDWFLVEVDSRSGYIAGQFLRSGQDEPATGPLDTIIPTDRGTVEQSGGTITPVAAVVPSKSPEAETGDGSAIAMAAAQDTLQGNQNTSKSLRRIIRYAANGRDPFAPIIQSSVSLSGLPRVENLTLVGVLFDKSDHIALFEDRLNGNQPFSFREEDPVEKGKVLKIYQDKVVFLITEYGISRSYTVEIARATQEKEAGNQ